MKFSSNPVEEHEEVPLADGGAWETMTQNWREREEKGAHNACVEPGERAYVVCVVLKDARFPPARRDEILGLVKAQGSVIVGDEIARITDPDPRALFRCGRAQEIALQARERGAEVLIVDAELSPSQCRNLEDMTGLQVRDREAVILHVFQRHIKTRRARIQVEIAHLEYLRPRIRGLGLEMDQQAGGVVSSKGAGETASELLARQLDSRLVVLRKQFLKIAKEGEAQRKRRQESKKISLVGYTNAGKTSLMNSLTEAGLSAQDSPFETLDTTSRSLTRYGGDVVISDTVGFIRNLPERLFASFESTLAEIQESDLLVLVVDISSPEASLHLRTTREMLTRLSADSIPCVLVFTKIDQCQSLPPRQWLRVLCAGQPHVVLNSHDLEEVGELRELLIREVRKCEFFGEVYVPYLATEAMNLVYAHAQVLASEAQEEGLLFTVEMDQRWHKRIEEACQLGAVACL